MRAMQRRHSASEERGPVGHTDRDRDIKILVSPPALRNLVDMWGLQDAIAHARQVIRTLLIGDNDKEIRFSGRQSLESHRRCFGDDGAANQGMRQSETRGIPLNEMWKSIPHLAVRPDKVMLGRSE